MNKEESKVDRCGFLSNMALIGTSGALGAASFLTACTGGENETWRANRPTRGKIAHGMR